MENGKDANRTLIVAASSILAVDAVGSSLYHIIQLMTYKVRMVRNRTSSRE